MSISRKICSNQECRAKFIVAETSSDTCGNCLTYIKVKSTKRRKKK